MCSWCEVAPYTSTRSISSGNFCEKTQFGSWDAPGFEDQGSFAVPAHKARAPNFSGTTNLVQGFWLSTRS